MTRSFHSLANKFHILAQQADIFGINQFTFRQHNFRPIVIWKRSPSSEERFYGVFISGLLSLKRYRSLISISLVSGVTKYPLKHIWPKGVWINSLNYVILLDACPFPYQDCYHPEGFSPRVAIGRGMIKRRLEKIAVQRGKILWCFHIRTVIPQTISITHIHKFGVWCGKLILFFLIQY
jgi:hypothetical protein